ncbi:MULTISPECIES: PilW family protein [unclassified Hydrogenophaga]|uniref:PilW family protein n=1 Tax=unclassified Hydrogenophaga TaxID=2610897 RepID=UPI00138F280E|nr:PilW family protein [Hydrogenophaga sp. Root209]
MSLIELLVGLAIGAIVSVAAVSSFGSTRSASATVGDSTRLQQDAAMAFRTIGHHIRQAGAVRLIDNGPGLVTFAESFVGYGNASAPQAIQGIDGANDAPDALGISHDSEVSLNAVDCLGQNVANDVAIRNNFELDILNQSLRCLGSGNSAPGPLIAGVEDFQVRYGRRINGNLQYQDASAGWTADDWNSVEAVMVCLRLAGQVGGHAGQANASGCNGQVFPLDGRIRRVFVRVFSLRNIAL